MVKNNLSFECIKGVLFFRIKSISFKKMYFIYNMIKDLGIRNIVINFSKYSIKNIIIVRICYLLVKKNDGLLVVCGSIKRKSRDIIVTENEIEALRKFA